MSIPTVSTRANNTPSSAVRKLVPWAMEAQKRGIKIYHVNIGQPDIPTPKPIISAIRNYMGPILDYAPSPGLAQTIEAWQIFYKDKNLHFDVKDIIVTSGGGEGITFSFLAVADPGDEIMVIEPFYTSYAILAAMGNIKLNPVTTDAHDGFHLPSRKTIEKSITKKTKAIIVCNPNNPTGTVYTDEEVKMLSEIAIKHNLFIISDEPYQEMVFEGRKVLPFASIKKLERNLIVIDSVSKRFNACGARIGCLASKNPDIISSVLRFAMGRLSVATVEQIAVIPLLTNHRSYVEKVRKIYEGRRKVVIDQLQKIPGVNFIPSYGAFYIIPQIPVKDSEDFAKYLLTDFSHNNETVMAAPAGGFYATAGMGKNEIRIAYVLEEKKLKRAIELLGLALKKYNN